MLLTSYKLENSMLDGQIERKKIYGMLRGKLPGHLPKFDGCSERYEAWISEKSALTRIEPALSPKWPLISNTNRINLP